MKFPTEWKIQFMFQTTNQLNLFIVFFGEHDDKPISAPHVSYLLSARISWNLFLGYHGIIRGIRCGIISWGEPGFTCFISTFLVGGIPTPEK
jgi:hypothetical protein